MNKMCDGVGTIMLTVISTLQGYKNCWGWGENCSSLRGTDSIPEILADIQLRIFCFSISYLKMCK
jgi:hypothetical protein